MRLIELLTEKKKHHHHKHSGIRYGFFPRLGIYSCAGCGHQCPITHAQDQCPACGASTATAPVNMDAGGAAAPS
jgi:rubrerythrin